jgi:hypothetical protein
MMPLPSWARLVWPVLLCLCLSQYGTACRAPLDSPGRIPLTAFELPDGFSGWVLVQYSQLKCADSDGVPAIIKVTAQGTACTARTRKDVWRDRRVRFASGDWVAEAPESSSVDHGGVFVWWGMGWTCERTGAPVETFFVGTSVQYKNNRDGWHELIPVCGRLQH